MSVFLEGVRNDFGASELHFTDIYSGRGTWKGVPVAKRIEIFDLMKHFVSSFALPIVHRTVSEETLDDHPGIREKLVRTSGSPWNLAEISHFGFLLLCFSVCGYAREMNRKAPSDFRLPMPLFVDEGLAGAGTFVGLPSWGDVIEGQQAHFCNSKDNPGIQIADFAAFAIARTQWIIVQQKGGTPIRKGDLEFLKTTSDLNLVNLPKVAMSLENVSKDAYEFLLSRDRQNKGLPPRPGKGPIKEN
ncbi:MAG TPA: DUF3800 domain-containing protein [Rhizomicrobium sp.]